MNIELIDLDNNKYLESIETIFFNTSSKTDFASDFEKKQFKKKYLDYYLENYTEYFYVSIDNDVVIGYLCCCPNTLKDDYFKNTFKYYHCIQNDKLLDYPAHLHINLTEKCRGRGIGSKLIEALNHDLVVRGVEGVHIFTTPENNNVHFYRKNLFCDELTVEYHNQNLLFLGRKISINDQ
jgi:ribosomal protein S18 acetylase RimI-like enzyme